jgi:hypothetical protein
LSGQTRRRSRILASPASCGPTCEAYSPDVATQSEDEAAQRARLEAQLLYAVADPELVAVRDAALAWLTEHPLDIRIMTAMESVVMALANCAGK